MNCAKKLSDRRTAVVAERIDMTYMTIHRLMKGQTPSLKTLQKLTEYFEQHPLAFMVRKGGGIRTMTPTRWPERLGVRLPAERIDGMRCPHDSRAVSISTIQRIGR